MGKQACIGYGILSGEVGNSSADSAGLVCVRGINAENGSNGESRECLGNEKRTFTHLRPYQIDLDTARR
jgi:hypothetical protein